MPYLLEDLVINRVDLVDEGANSASFIELYKRKESNKMTVEEILSKMKPEHASVIQSAMSTMTEELSKAKEDIASITTERDAATEELNKAKEDLNMANDDLANTKSELETLKAKSGCSKECECDGEEDENGMCKVCGKPKKKAKTGTSFDETETLKSMPQAARDMFEKMKAQKEAAEEEVRKAKEAEKTAEAVAKAKELKAIPVEQSKLVDIIKNANSDILDLLAVVNTAIEGTVLDEVGKSCSGAPTGTTEADAAWAKIDSKAAEIAKRDNITKQKAVSVVIKENPELYKEYLQGGAN